LNTCFGILLYFFTKTYLNIFFKAKKKLPLLRQPLLILNGIKSGERILSLKSELYIIFIALFITLFHACTPAPKFTSKKTPAISVKKPPEINQQIYKDLNSTEVLESDTGVASYYADKFNGKITYNGEVYDMYGLTAAHPTFPMGTILRVTNLSNDKSVIIRVNDRMPYRPDRIIDLSLGTAQALDMVEVGITEVRLDVLEWGEGRK
jgi:rare lipoprotein A